MPFALVSGHAPDFLAGVRKAIERGLPREAALRAVTLAPAEILGVSDRLGSLEAGKIANVVAWSGEPLTKDAKPKLVFVDGELYEPDDKPSPSPVPVPLRPRRRRCSDDRRRAGHARARRRPGRRPAAPPTEKTFAIMGGTVLTAGPQGTIPNGTVLVRGSRILAVGAGIPCPRARR